MGSKMRERRRALDMTQGELAEKAETTLKSIGRIERGLQNPSTSMIVNIADALNVPVETLITDTPDLVFARSELSGPNPPDIIASIPYANKPHGDISGETIHLPHYRINVSAGGGMLYVKRIERQVDGRVLIISDNKRYDPYYFNPDMGENKVFGRVVWYARTVI